MPRQAVFKPGSHTTKCRIVFGASSKRNGELSLNDVIHQGPLFLPNLRGVLLRSRIGSKFLTADVEKSFHMIYLQECERDAVRFWWLKNIHKPPSPENLRILRFKRLAFGINISPYLLGISIKFTLDQQENQMLCQEIQRNLYVDNVFLTASTSDSLITKYYLSKQLFQNMSMNLREYVTNDDTCHKYSS